jgi:hypothetical protein
MMMHGLANPKFKKDESFILQNILISNEYSSKCVTVRKNVNLYSRSLVHLPRYALEYHVGRSEKQENGEVEEVAN